MKKVLALVALLSALAGVLIGCGATPEPTEPPPTQTPWVIVFTPTPQPEQTTPAGPTRTRAASPTVTKSPTATEPSPESTASPETTIQPTQTEIAPTATLPAPTAMPEAPNIKYMAPVLLEPPTDQRVPWKSSLTLIWESVGELEEDEFYALKLERRPQTSTQEWWSGEVLLKETRYVLEGDFLAPFHYALEHGDAMVYWWVRVARKTGEDTNGLPVSIDIGALSEERLLILEPKPETE